LRARTELHSCALAALFHESYKSVCGKIYIIICGVQQGLICGRQQWWTCVVCLVLIRSKRSAWMFNIRKRLIYLLVGQGPQDSLKFGVWNHVVHG
jgi:hypothetical protein